MDKNSYRRGSPVTAQELLFGERESSLEFSERRRRQRLARLRGRAGRGNRPGAWRRAGVVLALVSALAAAVAALVLADRFMEEPVVHTVTPPEVARPGELNVPAAPESPEAVSEPSDGQLSGDPAALEKRIEEIAAYYGGVYGVVVMDPSSGETVAFGADETFFAASIGKVPTLLSLYKSAAQGEVDLDDEITVLASDVQGYGTGVLHTYPVGHKITLREAAYYLMHDSDNTAWKMLTRYLSVESIQSDLTGIGASDTEYWSPNTTTAEDTLLMLQKIADPSFTSPELSEEMLDTMTDTFSEDRIPGGLPPDVRVAHKIGTYENIFSDAGIVLYGDDRAEEKYFVVVFTEGMGEAAAQTAIQEISGAAHETFGPSAAGS